MTSERLEDINKIASKLQDVAKSFAMFPNTLEVRASLAFDELLADNACLRKAIENAPHDKKCIKEWQNAPCDCWKREALKEQA